MNRRSKKENNVFPRLPGANNLSARFFLILLCFFLLLPGCGEKRQSGEGPASDGRVTAPRPNETLSPDALSSPETDRQPEIRSVSFIGCGDNITYYGNTREAKTLAEPGRTYNFKPIFSEVAECISGADIAFLNQENVMSASRPISYYPMFNCPTDMGYDLWEIGFDVLNVATNHMLDAGDGGLRESISFLESLGFTVVGGYLNEEETNAVRVVEKNGIKIAFLGYTYSTNGLSLPALAETVIPYFEEDLIRRQFEKAKKEADVVLVSAHWGDENVFSPNAMQKKYAQFFADLGALAVIGHHPHVVQPIEWLTGEGGNKTLCVYSLGNFAAEMSTAANMCGGMISFDIVLTGSEASLENVLFTPTVYTFTPSFYQNRIRLLETYTDAEARSHGISYYGNHTNLEQLTAYFTGTISSVFLPVFLHTADR